jgi:hypothetical protein
MVELARTDQGVYDLMVMWVAASDDAERDETIANAVGLSEADVPLPWTR